MYRHFVVTCQLHLRGRKVIRTEKKSGERAENVRTDAVGTEVCQAGSVLALSVIVPCNPFRRSETRWLP
jgi:hypothetical protein